jgi:beta-galactosidase
MTTFFHLRKSNMIVMAKKIFFLSLFTLLLHSVNAQREMKLLLQDWKFSQTDTQAAHLPTFMDGSWRALDIPHDWSIEGNFSKAHPSTFNQGALPTGIGWYRKHFKLPAGATTQHVQLNFEGVFQRTDVWINGQFLGRHNNGYVSFKHDITPFLNKDGNNVIAVRVDNAAQPNSRWYTGSGIYRKVWLDLSSQTFIDPWDLFIKANIEKNGTASVEMSAMVSNFSGQKKDLKIIHEIHDARGKLVAKGTPVSLILSNEKTEMHGALKIANPIFWSPASPYLYQSIVKVFEKEKLVDSIQTTLGIRYFAFDPVHGFSLNGKHFLIQGVCNHHDLGAIGAAVNRSAISRQLTLLKEMGCNAIRTAHNPPSVELLDLCDSMGFLVMDEIYDAWAKRKNKFDQSLDFKNDHQSDVQSWIRRDRNHASIFMWSIGNEIREQFDSTGSSYASELTALVKALDNTRPVTAALTENDPSKNFLYKSGALDVLGFNYKLDAYSQLLSRFPGSSFIAAETASALATRGHYDFPSDTFRIWPPDSKSTSHGNPDHTVSAFDNVYAYWGNTHEKSWLAVKKHPHMSGAFVWSGFDFLGEPVPYQWPSRSSYYGIIDLAGFPKDVYFMYQSEWTQKPVLHLFPHWNWKPGQTVDVWAYFSQADEVELFLNGKSMGVRTKNDSTLHASWRIDFVPGQLKAVSRKNGKPVLESSIKTAGEPYRIVLRTASSSLKTAANELGYIEIGVLDAMGIPVQDADNAITLSVLGNGKLAATDNGNPVGMDPFTSNQKNLFNGKLLAIVKTDGKKGQITLRATSPGLQPADLVLYAY